LDRFVFGLVGLLHASMALRKRPLFTVSVAVDQALAALDPEFVSQPLGRALLRPPVQRVIRRTRGSRLGRPPVGLEADGAAPPGPGEEHAGGPEADEAAAAAGPLGRRAPSGPIGQVMKGIATADMPQMAKDMLDAMLEASIGVYKDKRDAYQTEVVEVIEEVLTKFGTDLQAKVDEASNLITSEAKQEEEFREKATEKEELIEEQRAVVLKRKHALAEVARAYKKVRLAAEEVEAAGRALERKCRSDTEKVEELKRLEKEIDGPTYEDINRVVDLEKRLVAVGISDSMMAAIPTVLLKPAGDRKPFDAMVLKTVKEELARSLVQTEQDIKIAEPKRAEDAAGLKEKQAAQEVVAIEQEKVADLYTEEHEKEQKLADEIAELHKDIRELKKAVKNNCWAQAMAKGNLETFEKGPKASFDELRDAMTPPPPPEVPAAAADAGEGAAAPPPAADGQVATTDAAAPLSAAEGQEPAAELTA